MPAKIARHPKRRLLKETPSVQYSVRREKARERQLAQEAELDREIQKYVGKWVAIAEGRVVAVSDTVEGVMSVARERGYDAPIIVRGPLTAGDTLHVFAA